MNETDTTAHIPGHLRRVADDFERLGQQLLHSSEANPFDAVTQLAVDRIPHAAAASITTLKRDRFVTSAATDDVARRADAIQYALGSGPCIDAIVDQAIYNPKDLASDDRWPEYGRRVQAELGLRQHVVLPDEPRVRRSDRRTQPLRTRHGRLRRARPR